MNLETGETRWADASFAPPAPSPDTRPSTGTGTGAGKKAERDVRWAMPEVSDDGTLAVAAARSADNKDRWLVAVDPETGKTRVVDTLHDDAWIREAGGGFGRSRRSVPARQQALWFLSERDGWMHLYTVDVSERQRRPSS